MSIKNPPLMNLLLTHGDANPNLLSIPTRGRTRRCIVRFSGEGWRRCRCWLRQGRMWWWGRRCIGG
ncbi:hypothetical protein B0T13DRAFT_470502 [Neurospora crassa]|nr:hypothetical protein B0T13DRAFT_470502 [Neurospora crassa]